MNILGLALSFGFIGLIVAIGVLMAYTKKFSPEVVRKFIHIAVSNWWIILLIFFDTLSMAVIGPIVFTIINGIVVFSGLADYLGVRDKKRNLGLVYFPISLLIIVLLSFSGTIPVWAATIGVFAMGYGDGLAALIGHAYGKKKIRKEKSLVGTLVMFAVTFTMIVIVGLYFNLMESSIVLFLVLALILSAILSFIELFTPAGLDNISVPISGALLASLILGVL